MKKISVSEAVLNYVSKESNVTPAVVVEHVNKPTNQLYTAIWKLVKSGKLIKDANGVLRIPKALPMTALKPNVPMAVDHSVYDGEAYKQVADAITKRKATGLEMSMGKKISVLESQNAELQRLLHETKVKYFDAMAVIKYLEAKLISVIK
jgi:hypothetical protein